MFAILHKKDSHTALLDKLKSFVGKENWSNDRFEKLNDLLFEVRCDMENAAILKSDILEISTSFKKEFLAETLQGHVLRKPYGYPGDFLLIDKIYTEFKTRNTAFRIWDEYFQQQTVPKAIRNSKEYFKKIIENKSKVTKNLKLLNVASGSGRELFEMYANNINGCKITTTCVELDDYAIAYSKGLNTEYNHHIEYVHSNIFNYNSVEKHNIIWSAGLCNYLSDNGVILLLEYLKNKLLPGGEIILGNFNKENNPSRNYLEIMGDWHLIHRTGKQLLHLAKQAGFLNSQISIDREALNVCLFLHVKL
ncbi:class I SAM-dependent methyltransferase [Aurantibacter sp.]|uniref:class I SAM-dependent methyltransferase n=1 Tax=Aurantibacter sp. TaxID=2807103 RepID=UPI0032666408